MGSKSVDKANMTPYQYWMREIDDSQEREKPYLKHGRDVVRLYEAQKKKTHQFNILYSNTETMAPALYNSVPRPDVKPKYKQSRDPVVTAGAKVTQKLLEAMLDTGDEDDTTAHSVFKQAVLEALVPGRGCLWLRYEAEVEEDAEGVPLAATNEYVCTEELPWDRFLCGYAKKWSKVPWVAAKWYMTKEELEKQFGPKVLAGVEFRPTAMEKEDCEEGEGNSADDARKPDMACVYEVWDKTKREVHFLSPSVAGKILQTKADPLGLQGFFPCPEPLKLFQKISNLTPVPLYDFYEEQAEELNLITYRINRIIKMLKVRGAYDSTLDGLKEMETLEDGEMMALEGVGTLGNGQGANLSNAIWFMPMKEALVALQQLYVQRDQIKSTIYEVTGISDILRGASQASETATAQNIKNQWGTLRLKRAQATVAIFCRSTLRMMAELALSKYSIETIVAMTGMEFPREAQQQQAKQMLAQMQAMGQQPPPEAAAMLAQPTWEAIMQLLRSDLGRNYKVDIETNSTVDVEATEDKKDFSELLNAISQFMNGVTPMVQEGMMPMPAAATILLSIVRRFRLGTEVEDQIMAMGQQKPRDPKEGEKAANQQKAQLEQQKGQMEMQKMQAAAQLEQQKMQVSMQHEQQKAQLELDSLQRKSQMEQQMAAADLQIKREEMQLKREEMQLKREMLQLQHRTKMSEMAAQAAQPKAAKAGGTA